MLCALALTLCFRLGLCKAWSRAVSSHHCNNTYLRPTTNQKRAKKGRSSCTGCIPWALLNSTQSMPYSSSQTAGARQQQQPQLQPQHGQVQGGSAHCAACTRPCHSINRQPRVLPTVILQVVGRISRPPTPKRMTGYVSTEGHPFIPSTAVRAVHPAVQPSTSRPVGGPTHTAETPKAR